MTSARRTLARRTLARRQFLHLAAGAAALPALSHSAFAQAYPSRPVRLVVQVGGGSAPDIIARVVADWLAQRLGQPIVVDNRPGASGNIATESVIRSAPDGYTLLFCMSANAINPATYDGLRFNFQQDTAPVAFIGRIPLVMEVNLKVPAKTVTEFIAHAKANPGKINIAATGTGTPLHVAGELFKMMAGINLVTVSYRGSPMARTDILGGQVEAMFGVVPESIPYIKSGQTRALAVASDKRLDVLPDVPAMAEFLPGYEASGWYGISAPKDTPPDVVALLNKEINAGLNDPKIKSRLAELGCIAAPGSPADYAKFVASDTEKWGKVARAAGIKAK